MNYRELKLGEIIQEGDEVSAGYKWEKVPTSILGNEVPLWGLYRRPLTPEETDNLFRKKLAALMEECGVGDISFDVYENITYSMGNRSDILGYALVTPKSLRESITSPTQDATEEE